MKGTWNEQKGKLKTICSIDRQWPDVWRGPWDEMLEITNQVSKTKEELMKIWND